ncbi:uncharacterized protein LOC116196493 [Punica granatum]|uniref:Uncharacterized protein LOC116196493 n=2 Tax=Punica granatum TaxID=22663 RepID=A0A6P8CDR7_PUNGR|nr:uncharacterized protein LOC116196493 [Punica granatum]XP_031382098.1 uncharacterized protein LOC116196493 [Punica granatum]OWM79328.1 hypothetical protein CDL15_Pgr003501 [Punica granatum]PKI50309.1 hypothetical protein CRG98_029382 [Punica granatum]
MSDFGPGRSNTWNIYTSLDPSPSQAAADREAEAPWKGFGASVNAISFGFVATAILISLFLIMAIFEHLFRPSPSFTSPEALAGRSLEAGMADKLGNPHHVSTSYAADFSVMMPGQDYPTFIAQPAPLLCPREGIHFPPHDHDFAHSVT